MSRLYGNYFRAVAPSKQVRAVIDFTLLATFVSVHDGTVVNLAWRARKVAAKTPACVSLCRSAESSLNARNICMLRIYQLRNNSIVAQERLPDFA